MNSKLLLLGLPIVLFLAVVAGINSLPQAHAAGFPNGPGTVCLVDSSAVPSLSAPGPCQSGPYTFDGPYPSAPQTGATDLRVGVYVNGSAAFGAFDVILTSDSSVLQPVGFDLTGGVIANPQVIVQCQGLILVQGAACASADTANTFEVSVIAAPGSGNTISPTTGLLFTAIYAIEGVAPSGGISLGFQSGCTNTSVSGGVCVTVSDGSATAVPETVQSGTLFNNFACASVCSIPWVAVTTNTTVVTITQGATTDNGVAVVPLPENAWPGLSADSISFTATASNGFAAPTFVVGNTCSPGGTSTPACPVALTLSTAKGGTYFVTISGTYVAFDTAPVTPATNTLVGNTIIQVNVQGVAWTINGVSSSNPQTFYMGTVSPMNLAFTAQSLGGYSGTVFYGTNSLNLGTTGISFAYPASFVLGSGQTVTQTISVSATSSGTALYNAALFTGSPTAGNQSSATLAIHVTGLSIIAAAPALTFAAFASATDSITVHSLPATSAGFVGKVTISKTVGGGALSVSCPASLTVVAGGTASGTCTFSGSAAGSFTVIITGIGGTNNAITNTTTVAVTVTATAKSIAITAIPTSLTSPINSNPFSTIKVVGGGGLTGTVFLSVTTSPITDISCSLSNIGIPTPKGNSTLSCSSTVPQVYTVTVTGIDGSVTNSVSLTFTFTDFSISSSPSTLNTTPGVAQISTIIVLPLNGFTDTVALSQSFSPSSGLSCTLSATTIPSGNGNSTLTCSGVGGSYAVTILGSDGALSHSTTVTVNVQDFTLNASPGSITIPLGPPAGTTMITVNALGGFSGTVAFTSSAPIGISAIINPSSVTISGTSQITIGASAPIVPGTYLVNITGTSGSLTHIVTITVTVTSVQAIQPPFFTQGTWNHRFSLSKYNDLQTFRFGVANNSTGTIYVSVTISGTSGSGAPFTLSTGVFSLSHNQNMANIPLAQSFTPSQIGETFTFQMVIHWGTVATTDPSQLPFTSSATNGAPTSGTFTVLP